MNMKRYSILTVVLAALVLLGSCSKDKDFVRIDSISVLGDEFPQGATVQLGMSAEVSDVNARYDWFCDGGTILERQNGYVTMTWTAPMASGEYTVGCTVTVGSASETRTVKIRVTGLFFDRFVGATSTWTKSGNSANLDVLEGRLTTAVTATANAPADSVAYATKALGKADFYPPVSVTARTGIMGGIQNPNTPKYPVTAPPYAWETIQEDLSTDPPTPVSRWTVGNDVPPDAIRSRVPGWDNPMGFGLTGDDPGVELASTHYISEVRLDWWPTTHMQSTLRYYSPTDEPYFQEDGPAPVAPVPPSTIAAADFNARVAIRWERRQSIAPAVQAYGGWIMIPFKHAAFEQGLDVDKVVGISVAEDYTISVVVDKETVYTTDGLKVWKSTWMPSALFKINEVKYQYPKRTRVYLDDVVANDKAEFMY